MGKVCTKLSGREGNVDIGQTIDQIQKQVEKMTGLALPKEAHKADMHQVPLTGRRRSLLIGINYCGTQNELHGCANDVKRMIPAIEKLGFSADSDSQLVLLDEQDSQGPKPTHANIAKAIRWLVEGARDGDSLFFHYSGHGGREAADNTSDGYHETLVPLDFETAGMLRDTELFDVLVKPLPGGCRLTCILDSCHSAGALNLPYRFVGSESELKSAMAGEAYQMAMSKNWAKDVELWKNGQKMDLLKDVGAMGMGLWNLRKQAQAAEGGDATGFKVEEQENTSLHVGEVVAITGCRSDQTSADVGDVSQQFHLKSVGGNSRGHLMIDRQRVQNSTGGAGGALTTALLEALKDHGSENLSYFDLLELIRKELASKGFSQVPQVATSLVVDLKQNFALDTYFVLDDADTEQQDDALTKDG